MSAGAALVHSGSHGIWLIKQKSLMSIPPPRRALTSRHYESGAIVAEKYELERLLGEGGMGSVWLARNRMLELPVALKLLRADFDAADAADRLLREARIAARIDHRAIVRVFDFGNTSQGDPFIVMELLEGKNLAEVLAEQGPLDPIEAVRLLLPVVDALAAAHDAGVVHRDLKPANIFLVTEQRRTQPKIVDFGIAKMNQGSSEAARALTRHGDVVGSPGYMSPEQARGLSQFSAQTDVWALCVVLYECIMGRPPFVGDNYNAWLRAIIEDEAPPTVDFGPGGPALWRIIDRGLRKTAEERWSSMRELGAQLASWLLDREIAHDVCGDSVDHFLVSSRDREVVSSGRRQLASVHSGFAAHAITLQSADSSSRSRAFNDDESSYRESASPLTHTNPPDVGVRMSRSVIAFTTLTVVATLAGIIAAFGTGTRNPADAFADRHAHQAAAGFAPAMPPAPHPAAPEIQTLEPKPPSISPAAAEQPLEAAPQPSSSASRSRRDVHQRVVGKLPSAPASASEPSVPAPSVTASNPDLKDPY
jgi:serine/threonine-protein kinase